jgi:hypothetical protein
MRTEVVRAYIAKRAAIPADRSSYVIANEGLRHSPSPFVPFFCRSLIGSVVAASDLIEIATAHFVDTPLTLLLIKRADGQCKRFFGLVQTGASGPITNGRMQ